LAFDTDLIFLIVVTVIQIFHYSCAITATRIDNPQQLQFAEVLTNLLEFLDLFYLCYDLMKNF